MANEKKTIKCLGRFKDLREYLYNDVLPIVAEERTLLDKRDLENTWDLIRDDIWNFDQRDPYYYKTDVLRKTPNLDSLSLVPLIESPYSLDKGIIQEYCLSMGNSEGISEKLEKIGESQTRFFRDILKRGANTIIFPNSNNKNLAGYIINSGAGVGTIVPGGVSGGGIRSDAPFIFGVYHTEKKERLNLAGVIGFWSQDNEMIVSQMQSCRNARLPEGVKFGEACLYLAEIAAREMGFKQISTYSARNHPIFKEHNHNWEQFGKDFVCIYDNSAKKLGYNGSRNSSHSKVLK